MVGHASIRIHSGGKTLLTDPWYIDPINCNALFHWPPLVPGIVETLVQTTDAIYVSHVHPDHFDPRTLKLFPRSVPIYIGEYKHKAFRDELKGLGFSVHETPFQQLTPIEGTPFEIAIIESDYAESAAYDSSMFVRTPEFSAFNNNDCFLKAGKYEWVRDHFRVDYAFLGFSPASYYPICFEYDEAEKARLLKMAADRRYADFIQVVKALEPRVSIPFAMGIRFLHESMLWQNVSFNSNIEAVRRAVTLGYRAETLNPGDRILPDGTVARRSALLSDEENDLAIRAFANDRRDWINRCWAEEEPARPGLIGQFNAWMVSVWKQTKDAYPEVRDTVIAYDVTGPQGGQFYFDFSKPDVTIFSKGVPASFDMRYRYEDKMLQLRMDRKIDWDELHFSNRVSVHQNRYPAQFYSMIRAEGGLNSVV